MNGQKYGKLAIKYGTLFGCGFIAETVYSSISQVSSNIENQTVTWKSELCKREINHDIFKRYWLILKCICQKIKDIFGYSICVYYYDVSVKEVIISLFNKDQIGMLLYLFYNVQTLCDYNENFTKNIQSKLEDELFTLKNSIKDLSETDKLLFIAKWTRNNCTYVHHDITNFIRWMPPCLIWFRKEGICTSYSILMSHALRYNNVPAFPFVIRVVGGVHCIVCARINNKWKFVEPQTYYCGDIVQRKFLDPTSILISQEF